jgi:uncharacterized membrane protein
VSGVIAGPGVVGGLLLLGLGTLAMKAAGPVLVGGGRRVPAGLLAAGGVLPTALLAALVATDVLGAGGPEPARLAGVAVAAAAVALRAPFVVVVLAATATTAVLRALGA